jgi:hypothetical protein
LIAGSASECHHQPCRPFAVRFSRSEANRPKRKQNENRAPHRGRPAKSGRGSTRLAFYTASHYPFLGLFGIDTFSFRFRTSPSYEWQVQVIAMLDTIAARGAGEVDYHYPFDQSHSQDPSVASNQPRLQVVMPSTPTSENLISPTRRQRRRIGADDGGLLPNGNIYASQSPPSARPGRTKIPVDNSIRSLSPLSEYHWAGSTTQLETETGRRRDCSSLDSFSTDSEEDLAGATGQLSLNEEEQVRFHGKASGLHLLGVKDRIDSRNEGGIW